MTPGDGAESSAVPACGGFDGSAVPDASRGTRRIRPPAPPPPCPSAPVPPPRGARRGFTLIEILIVITIIGILITLAQPSYHRAVTAAKEATLRENLFILRDVIDQFYADSAKYPASLSELAEKGYIRRVPKDPVTGSPDTWVVISAADEQGQPVGVFDVRSGAETLALDGSKYSDW
jgi:general secretion pathway protein G